MDVDIKRDPRMDAKFESYPEDIKPKLEYLRSLIIEAASEIDGIGTLEETLKWGEPSYLVKKGSTIRMDWKQKNPDKYAIYFKCTSKLVVTFRELYGDSFNCENNRANLFGLDDEVPDQGFISLLQSDLLSASGFELIQFGYDR